VAHVLHEAGCRVVLHDDPRPAHSRRGMAFADALFEGLARLEGQLAKRIGSVRDLGRMLECRRAIVVTDQSLDVVLAALQPQVLVDARMRKRERPEAQRGRAPLTIGLGPNFIAGEHVDLVIETAWGEEMGAVKRAGAARALAGEPKPLGGHSRDRFVYAPGAGTFRTARSIGEHVAGGDEVGRIGDLPLRAPISGIIRGLVHDAVQVSRGAKVIEVDPRGEPAGVYGLGERPRRIAAGVLRAMQQAGF
jgi:xanthine dehydrogenase accessory factor